MKRPIRDPFAALTVSQFSVVEWVTRGLSNGEIAERLGISIHTVKKHLAAAMEKLPCAGRAGLMSLWHRRQGRSHSATLSAPGVRRNSSRMTAAQLNDQILVMDEQIRQVRGAEYLDRVYAQAGVEKLPLNSLEQRIAKVAVLQFEAGRLAERGHSSASMIDLSPATEGEAQGSEPTTLEAVRAQIAKEKDPVKKAALCRQARELRGDADMFTVPPVRPKPKA